MAWVNHVPVGIAGPAQMVTLLPAPLTRPVRVGRWGLLGELPRPVRGAPNRLLGGLGTLGFSSQASGAVQGAKFGSVAGPFGAAIGAIGGAIFAALNKADQEVQNFNQAIAIANAGGPDAVLNIANKYLVLAGLFDLTPSQVKGNFSPYNRYGRLGEQRFVTDMMTRIYQAAQAGLISPNDTIDSVYAKIVDPWIQGMGAWSQSMPNAPMLLSLIKGMIGEYGLGLQKRWLARSGDYPFSNLPTLTFPQATAPPAPPVPTQVPQVQVPVVTAPPVGPVVSVQAPVSTLPVQTAVNFPATQAPQGSVVYTGAGGGGLTSITPATTAQPAPAPTTVVPVPQMPNGQLDVNSLVNNLLAQGQSQQQAYQSAMASLQAQGVPPSAAVQQQVGQAVTSGVSGISNPALLLILGALAVSFALARPVGPPAKPRKE